MSIFIKWSPERIDKLLALGKVIKHASDEVALRIELKNNCYMLVTDQTGQNINFEGTVVITIFDENGNSIAATSWID